MANEYENYVNHSGMTVEQVNVIDKDVKRYVNDSEQFWKKYFKPTSWVRGQKTFEHRKHIRPEVTLAKATSFELAEGYGAVKSGITVVKWTDDVKDYGTFTPYTAEALQYNIDDVISLASDNFQVYAVEVPEVLRAKAMCTSNFQMTAENTITATLDKAKVILDKAKSKKINAGGYVAIMTPELVAKLKSELRANGASLDEITKEEVTKEGSVYKYNGFYITERSDEPMYDTDTDKIVFVVKTRDNELPGAEVEAETDVFDNGLGSGLIRANGDTGATATYVADTNRREGSIALNIKHLGLGIQADMGHLVCTFAHTDYKASATPSHDPISGVTDTSTAGA